MKKQILLKELQFKAVRSSGPGGQHVNKVSSKIELTFNVKNSLGLSEFEKEVLLNKLSNRLTKENILILFCDKSRSQHQNKTFIITRFFHLLEENLKPVKKRRPTKPKRGTLLKNSEKKKRHSAKKLLRKKPRY